MNNTWYYSEGDKSVGPLSLADLTTRLSRVSNARGVLVWRDGFSSWVRAENVPELAAHIPAPLMQEPVPSFPAMSLAERWGKGIVRAGGLVLVVYLMDLYFDGKISDFRVYWVLFIAFLFGWLDGTKQIDGKRPKRTISQKGINTVAVLSASAFLIYLAATTGMSSSSFKFFISFFIVLAIISFMASASRWLKGQSLIYVTRMALRKYYRAWRR
jgi:hypothetical protein